MFLVEVIQNVYSVYIISDFPLFGGFYVQTTTRNNNFTDPKENNRQTSTSS